MKRLLHRLIHKVPLAKCQKCDRVWATLLADDDFRAKLDAGIKDMEEGRWYFYDHGVMTPNPDWPEDGEQPRPQAPG